MPRKTRNPTASTPARFRVKRLELRVQGYRRFRVARTEEQMETNMEIETDTGKMWRVRERRAVE